MKNVQYSFLILVLSAFMVSCTVGKELTGQVSRDKGPAILTFNTGLKVYKGEFEYVYQKNNGGWDEAKNHNAEQLEEYLDLYINFKRKVMEAEKLGLHDLESFKKEFEGYRKQLAQPYLVDKSVQEGLIKEAYERSKWIVSASHILIVVGPEAPPEDTLVAYEKAMNIRDSIVSGAEFAEMAKRHSADPSAATNDGYLGYFSVFDMVYPFETGAYNTTPGEVSKPVRTGYGYHLLSVHEKLNNAGKKSVSHILVRIGQQYSAKDTNEAKTKIDEIYKKLKKGADFDELAGLYSDDQVTAKRGGDLGDGRLIPIMEEKKQKLAKGEYSEPFNTSFGWHIIFVSDVEEIKSFNDSKSTFKNKVSRDARSTLSKEKLIQRVKKEYNLKINKENIATFIATIDEANQKPYMKGFWRPVDSIHGSMMEMEIYTLGSKKDRHIGTLDDYVQYYIKARTGYDGATIEQVTDKMLEGFYDEEALNFEEAQLPKKYPEYRELVKEYRDGILLFTLTEDKVWKKAVEDTTGLKEYYEGHKDEFQADERLKVKEFQADNEAAIKLTQKLLRQEKSEEDISKEVNEESSLSLKIRTLSFEKGKSEPEADLWGKETDYRSEIIEGGKSWFIYVVVESIPPGIKAFKDSKAECITKYQNHLEAEWLRELAENYPVKRNQDAIDELFK